MSRLLYRSGLRRALFQAPVSVSVPARNVRTFASAAAATGPQFNWEDPLGSKNLLTEEELAISETAERYCQEQLLPRVLRMFFF